METPNYTYPLSRRAGSGGEAGGGEVDLLQHGVEGLGVAAELVGVVGAQAADDIHDVQGVVENDQVGSLSSGESSVISAAWVGTVLGPRMSSCAPLRSSAPCASPPTSAWGS